MKMRLRQYVIGAVALAVAVGGFAVWEAVGPATTSGNTRAAAVTSTIVLDPYVDGEVFAPPPADASPALTAQQAIDIYAGKRGTKVPPGVTVQLGLFTLPVGPDCGLECENGNTVSHGKVYSWLNQLVYGLSRWECPAGSKKPAWKCREWDFLDANTGKMIAGLGPPLGGSGSS
jgi:hypothetical protein